MKTSEALKVDALKNITKILIVIGIILAAWEMISGQPIGMVVITEMWVIIAWCMAGIIYIFVDTFKECDRIEKENFESGKNMTQTELEKAIMELQNIKTKRNSFGRLETSCKIQGFKKALKEKTSA